MNRIFLLGGFGFIGSNLLKYIDTNLKDKYSVVVLDRSEMHPHGLSFNCVEKVFSGDYTDGGLLNKILKYYTFDLVIHSLSTTVPNSADNARYDIETNLIPAIELLNAMVDNDVKDIVFISSGGAIYGVNDTDRSHKEDDDAFPISSYGVVKLATEKYLFQYASLYKIQPLVLRLSNPYGKYHYSKKQGVCNVAARAAVRDEVFSVWGSGEGRKDYIYIDDFCDILFKLHQNNTHTQVLNVGSGITHSINEILAGIKNVCPDFKWDKSEPALYDVVSYELDNQRLLDLLGGYQFTNFKDGLRNTINWHKDIEDTDS